MSKEITQLHANFNVYKAIVHPYHITTTSVLPYIKPTEQVSPLEKNHNASSLRRRSPRLQPLRPLRRRPPAASFPLGLEPLRAHQQERLCMSRPPGILILTKTTYLTLQ